MNSQPTEGPSPLRAAASALHALYTIYKLQTLAIEVNGLGRPVYDFGLRIRPELRRGLRPMPRRIAKKVLASPRRYSETMVARAAGCRRLRAAELPLMVFTPPRPDPECIWCRGRGVRIVNDGDGHFDRMECGCQSVVP